MEPGKEEIKQEGVKCPVCNKSFKNNRGLLIHSRVHDSKYEEKRQEKKQEKEQVKKTQEKKEEKILYLRVTEKQYKSINSTYSNTIQHKIDCRNRAREKLGITESYIKEDDLLNLDGLIIDIEKLKVEITEKVEK